ncbi:hypothetical protein NRB20_36110 [Nocardia sp. RB20]|uniref:DUF320 domain-containing protein n=1 Tax=Nocardia macrotermitis TaxID=2585198 RepID=A0A7K0D445_9NOCA|nr:hypothetical protein [Nocardia macrotermitis]
MKLRRLIGVALMGVAATGALYGTASAIPVAVDTGSASGSADGSADGSSGGGTPCNDGTSSPSTGPGTCSHHGGESKNEGHVHHGGGGYSHHR